MSQSRLLLTGMACFALSCGSGSDATAGGERDDGASDAGSPARDAAIVTPADGGSQAPTAPKTPSGGTLAGGTCYPSAGKTVEELGADVEVLATYNRLVFGPEAHTTGVYYSVEKDGVYRLPPGVDTPEQLIATPDSRYTPWIDHEHLYFRISGPSLLNDPSSVVRVPLQNPRATPQKIFDEEPRDYSLSATHAYLLDDTTGTVTRRPLAGGAEEVVFSELKGTNIQVTDDGHLYFERSAYDHQIWRKPLAGGAEELIVDGIFDLRQFTVTDTGIFWTSPQGLYFTAFGEKPTARTPFFVTVTTGYNFYHVLRITDDRLYWIQYQSLSAAVGWTMLDRSDCKTLIDGRSELDEATVADDAIYISTFSTDHKVYRISRE